MRKEIVPLSITAPARQGEPAVLECGLFGGHIHKFDESLEESFRIEFPSCTVDQLGVKSKCDTGFERYFSASVAIGYSLGLRAGKTSALVESAAAKARATTVAAAVKATAKSFAELVSDQISAGKSKSDSVRFCIVNHPKEYAAARVVGIPSL